MSFTVEIAAAARREESPSALRSGAVERRARGSDPEYEVFLADSVGLALLVVLDRLNPAERLAFVLHDMFAVPYDEIGRIVERSPTAARQLASRARRRVQGPGTVRDADVESQRRVVDAFLTVLRAGDFEGLLAVLDPDVVVRFDAQGAAADTQSEIRGARTWTKGAINFSRMARFVRPAFINGAVGVVWAPQGRLLRVLTFVVADGRIKQVDVVADPARLRDLDLAIL